MVAVDADTAMRNAYVYSTCVPGRCLAYVRTWLQIPARYDTASHAWANTNNRHAGIAAAPRGAPMFWTGGSRGFGHIALSTGDGYVRSTDVPIAGWVRTVPFSWFAQHWPGVHYAGWAEDLNEVNIPWLNPQAPPPPDPAHPPNSQEDAWMGTIDAISTNAANAIAAATATQVWTRYQPGGQALSNWLYSIAQDTRSMREEQAWQSEAIKAIAAKMGVTLPNPPPT